MVRWLLLTQVKYGGFDVAQSSTTLKTLRFDKEKKGGGEEGVNFKSYISQVSLYLVVVSNHDWVFL